jgi:hypothetical protein
MNTKINIFLITLLCASLVSSMPDIQQKLETGKIISAPQYEADTGHRSDGGKPPRFNMPSTNGGNRAV